MQIDVVIPIYNAYDALKNCLKSLERHSYPANNIILIDDASTDTRIKPYINKISSRNNWQVKHHTKNLGFVKTANQGLKLSQHNTILLNSDTVVSKYWLAAFKQINIKNLGTATAWSNNAEICSFPKFLTNNSLPKDCDKISDILFNKYTPKYPTIPTAVGFCMMITKLAKQQVGYFDENHFGHGYGEENDYSLRIQQAGLQNILCDNAYVAHLGNESFSEFGLQPSADTMQRLLKKHPNYNHIIHEFITKDPLSDIRKKILAIINQNNSELYKELIS